MKLGYARVSTVGQDLQTQIEKLKNVGITDDYLYIEKNLERPQEIDMSLKIY
ncbi:recombinase family protein (plasmid) [Listeria monocytogenes]|nr:recombinase family protein [Listeria monocytogenes]WOS31778.1 recombinase family protein [Listeria monocytogenes]WOS34211.1 recombinase family protein [Listeria monocytogenes]WOS36443.1 recombinase family protein [Listeria monocytogenes]WOX33826.1 recombinase family protein [Listeria monocytogenes]